MRKDFPKKGANPGKLPYNNRIKLVNFIKEVTKKFVEAPPKP